MISSVINELTVVFTKGGTDAVALFRGKSNDQVETG